MDLDLNHMHHPDIADHHEAHMTPSHWLSHAHLALHTPEFWADHFSGSFHHAAGTDIAVPVERIPHLDFEW